MAMKMWDAIDALDVSSADAQAVLNAIPDNWAKVEGEWVQVAQADRYDVEGPSGVIDGANVLVTLPQPKEG